MNKVKNNPIVSIIVPVYKVERYLQNCVLSVMNQTYSNWELILVDDGSPDNCGQICDDFANKDSRIKVIHKLNGGLSDARNAGLEVFSGDFIAFLDSDDFWHENYLMTMMSLQVQYDADIVQCKWTRGNSNVFPQIDYDKNPLCFTGPQAIATGNFDVMMWGKIYRRSVIDGIRMPVGIINEDDWTSWKICYKASRFVSIKTKLYYYTFNQQGICATTSRVLDLGFFGAFEEKEKFFSDRHDDACAIWNLKKWNKAIILKYRIRGTTKEQRFEMMYVFKKNYFKLCRYSKFGMLSRLYFGVFMKFPMFLSNISETIRNLKRDHKLIRYKKQ